VDESRRNFILGVSSAYAALSVSAVTGASMILKTTNNVIEKKNANITDWKFSSYEGFDAFSPALIGSAISSFMLNNIEYLYSLIITLLTLLLLFTIGIPGYEYLLSYSELYSITN
jgi:hypothetical protein